VLIAILGYYQQHNTTGSSQQQNHSDTVAQAGNADGSNDFAIEQAIEQRRSDVQLTVVGTVKKILNDDNEGSRHQRILVELPSGHTVLVAHNIDLAARVPDLQPGDAIELHGEYVWNDRGGVMHWTHHDPAGRHAAGWIKHGNRTYQ
jgi:hypothetical protein